MARGGVMRGLKGILVGCGFFARNHLHGWAEVEGAAIVATCDLDGTKAARAAEEFGIPRHGSDLARLLEEIAPDFVDIVTTSPSHRALVEAAAAPRRLILVQKPMADEVADAIAMVEACERVGAQLIVHENFRWQAPFREALRRFRQGDLGRIEHSRFAFRHGFDNYVNQPYLAEIARFAISDVGTHLFDLAQLFCGRATGISCLTQRRNPKVRGEDSFTAMLSHEEGAVSIAECSFESRLQPHRFPQTLAAIEGSRGSLEIGEDYVVSFHGSAGRETYSVEPQVPSWGGRPWHVIQDSVTAFLRHATEVMRNGIEPMPSGAFTVNTVALVDAAYRSAAEGKRISIKPWRSA
jgi:predicted dehydrogenase